MTERRLHVAALLEEGGELVLSAEASKHVRVLRLRVGDPVVLFDGHGRRADARIVRVEGEVVCACGAPRSTIASRPVVHLVQAMPKQATLEDVVRSTTELGVCSVHLAITVHAVPKLDAARGDKRRDRLARIAEEAARQCERDDVPMIHEPSPLLEVIARAPSEDVRVVLCGRSGRGFPSAVSGPIWLVVGPEGGLSPEEVEMLVGRGFLAVSLADTTMRVDTAATAAVAIAMDRSRR